MEKEGRKKVERKLVFSIVWYATENGEEMRWSRCFLPNRAQKKKKKAFSSNHGANKDGNEGWNNMTQMPFHFSPTFNHGTTNTIAEFFFSIWP